MLTNHKLIQFWLPIEKLPLIDNPAKCSGLSRSAYLRLLIDGIVPQDMPPPDYHEMTKELRAIGNNLNQLARKAHAFGSLNADEIDAVLAEHKQALFNITEAVYKHSRRTKWQPPQSGQ